MVERIGGGKRLPPTGIETWSNSGGTGVCSVVDMCCCSGAGGRVPGLVASLLNLMVGAGRECYIVGGAARAMLLGQRANDWDVATSASPSDIGSILRGMNLIRKGERHGTIGVERDGVNVEFTTFRTEGEYSDGRRPDSVRFVSDIREDLSRRDFTLNAIALRWPDLAVVDPFHGARDLRRGILRCVGDAAERFREDALRMMRAVRFESEHGWTIERRTRAAIATNAGRLDGISRERVRDELSRLIVGPGAAAALRDMISLGLMARVIPEFMDSVGYPTGSPDGTLDEHAIRATESVRPFLPLRLAALLHDIAKPGCFIVDGDGRGRFFGHDSAGAEMAGVVLRRLKYPGAIARRVRVLIREHMFFYDPSVTDAGLRRLIGRVGEENVFDLLELRRADAAAWGVAAGPFLKQVENRIRFILDAEQPVNGSSLAVDGRDVMAALGIGPGPRVGKVLRRLLEAVMNDPALNERGKLMALIESMRACDSQSTDS